MRIVISPDSFKGNISAKEFCEAAELGIREVLPDAEIISLPLADGGEGTLDCMLAATGGISKSCIVRGAFLEEKEVRVGFFADGKTAVVESAMAMGLPSVKGQENPELTSSVGVGDMMRFALEQGASQLIISLGGSSTNDCGAGLLSALGVSFYDRDGNAFIPTGGSLKSICKIDASGLRERLCGVSITAMCDVTNPLCGENGCSHIYGPQKGADAAMVERLDTGCRHFALLAREYLGVDYSNEPGAGAAGGLGFACVAFLGAKLQSGIDTVLDLYDFDEKIKGCDLLITGEGSFDSQSLMGKALGGLNKRAAGVPTAVFCGISKLGGAALPGSIVAVKEISEGQSLEYALSHGRENVRRSAAEFIRNYGGR